MGAAKRSNVEPHKELDVVLYPNISQSRFFRFVICGDDVRSCMKVFHFYLGYKGSEVLFFLSSCPFSVFVFFSSVLGANFEGLLVK